jgi:hypothetical protein
VGWCWLLFLSKPWAYVCWATKLWKRTVEIQKRELQANERWIFMWCGYRHHYCSVLPKAILLMIQIMMHCWLSAVRHYFYCWCGWWRVVASCERVHILPGTGTRFYESISPQKQNSRVCFGVCLTWKPQLF